MQIKPTPLEGLLVVELKVIHDERGYFMERFNEEKYAGLGLPTRFVQDNHSSSLPGVLRGMHFQWDPPQGKLVGAISGRIYDVAIDVRPKSPTFGQHFGIELSGENGKILWVPAGFAHGLCVIGDEKANVMYKVTAPWNPKGEGGIRFDDPALGIQWPAANPIVNARDRALPTLAEWRKTL